jgi:hypothetical protein
MDDLTRLIESLPPEALAALLPPHLRGERPTQPEALAYHLLAAETGDHPDAHLPCRAGGPGCERCWDKGEELRASWAGLDYSQMTHPHAEREARSLILYWYSVASLTGTPIVVHGIPGFSPGAQR